MLFWPQNVFREFLAYTVERPQTASFLPDIILRSIENWSNIRTYFKCEIITLESNLNNEISPQGTFLQLNIENWQWVPELYNCAAKRIPRKWTSNYFTITRLVWNFRAGIEFYTFPLKRNFFFEKRGSFFFQSFVLQYFVRVQRITYNLVRFGNTSRVINKNKLDDDF